MQEQSHFKGKQLFMGANSRDEQKEVIEVSYFVYIRLRLIT